MTTLRLALSELKRMTRGTLPKLAIIALSCVPLLYGALYLYANWDPQSHLSGVRAALVNLDEGAEKSGKDLHVGDDVTRTLLEDGTFGWELVDSETAANAGVASGEYSFAMTIPADFSANLASPADFEHARQALLKITTNDANNFMVGTFADTLANEVHTSVAKEVGTQTADSMIAGFVDIHSSMAEAADGAEQVYDGTLRLADGVATLNDGTRQLLDGSRSLASGSAELSAGTRDLKEGSSSLVDGQTQLRDGAKSLAEGTGTLDSGASELHEGLSTMQQQTKTLPDSVQQLDDGTQDAAAAARKLADGSEQVAEGNAALNAKVTEAAEVITALEAETGKQLESAEKQALERIQGLVDTGVITQEQADSLVEEVSAALQEATGNSQLAQRAKDAKAELATAQDQIQQLADGSAQVADGNAQLASGLATLAKGTGQLNQAVPTLVAGIDRAATGSGALAEGAGQLDEGAGELYSGQVQALSGAKQLDSGAGKLTEGAGQLAEGSTELSTGLEQLQDGVSELGTGSADLSEGSQELATGLSDGTDQVPNPDAATQDRLAKVMGDPVSVDRTDQAKAGAYGEGLAPFFITLATWIGAFILTQVMRPITKRALASNGRNWKIAVGGWMPFFLLSVIQSSLLYAVVLFWLGLDSAHPWLTWGLLFLASMAFTAIIQGICALAGAAGKFVVLVLMVLQLVTAGGTFPWETLPEPLHVLHRILPMGHVVVGLRHLIYGADLSVLTEVVLGLLGYTLLGLLLSTLAVRKHKTWTLKSLQPELSI